MSYIVCGLSQFLFSPSGMLHIVLIFEFSWTLEIFVLSTCIVFAAEDDQYDDENYNCNPTNDWYRYFCPLRNITSIYTILLMGFFY